MICTHSSDIPENVAMIGLVCAEVIDPKDNVQKQWGKLWLLYYYGANT